MMSIPIFSSHLVLLCVFILSLNLSCIHGAWSDNDKVKLVDVKTITLYQNKMTTGRRTSPVPQLQCVGGSAGCSAFVPSVIQCYNKGSNGYDVQWECKTDMDNAYRFGNIEVVCEGYDYPNDPYVLKGSCGLEYTIDFTKEGHQKKGQSYFKRSNDGNLNKVHQPSKFGHLFLLVAVGIIIYALYKTCLQTHQYSNTSSDFPSGNDNSGFFGNLFGGGHRGSGYGAPPPPGFRSDFTDTAGCSGASSGTRGNAGSGFWTGAMTGGLLGYMFGRSNQDSYGRTYGPSYTYRERSYDSNWGESSHSDSTGTRTASGFGETRRR